MMRANLEPNWSIWRLTLLTFENFIRFLFEKQSGSRTLAWKGILIVKLQPFDRINFQNFIAWSREVTLSKIPLIERTNKIESNVPFPKFHLSTEKNKEKKSQSRFLRERAPIKIKKSPPLRAKIRLIQLVRTRLEKYKGFSVMMARSPGFFVHRNYLHCFPPPLHPPYITVWKWRPCSPDPSFAPPYASTQTPLWN